MAGTAVIGRRRRRVAEGLPKAAPDPLAAALIHLGQAWRSHQEGRSVLALYHLRLAAEAVGLLLATWEAEDDQGEESSP